MDWLSRSLLPRVRDDFGQPPLQLDINLCLHAPCTHITSRSRSEAEVISLPLSSRAQKGGVFVQQHLACSLHSPRVKRRLRWRCWWQWIRGYVLSAAWTASQRYSDNHSFDASWDFLSILFPALNLHLLKIPRVISFSCTDPDWSFLNGIVLFIFAHSVPTTVSGSRCSINISWKLMKLKYMCNFLATWDLWVWQIIQACLLAYV